VLATGEGASSALGLVASCEEDLVFFLGRFPDITEGEPYGSNLFPLFELSATRPSVRRGGMEEDDKGPVRRVEGAEVGEISISSASPQYRSLPSESTSTLGGLRKCVLSRYSGEISSEASSGKEDGERRRPFSTSSIL